MATHIVGGEMNYTCLGNNEYEITLTIFRDCYNGNPNAWFDDPASIGVFDVNNNLLNNILIPLMGNDTLDPVLNSECLVAPPDVCVHTTTYRTVVELPPIIGGYQLAYQRCCRNQTIVNIIDPLASGATYGVTISEQALLECNSNAKFQEWPPIYICVNEPIAFDQSAVDPDGDSIVYRLCTPLLGADPDVPMPQPPNPPPYEPINWVDPPYNVDNMLNGISGGVPLEINAETGLLTGLPNTIGQFVVGICIEEYRNGELISTTRRDFQYNVGVCGQAVSSFFAPEIQCESFTVEFENESLGADNFLWLFGDPNNPGASSTVESPSYTYSDTGLYTIMLIAEPGTICQDTSIQQVRVEYNSLFPDFEVEYAECSDSLTIQVTDNSMDTLSTVESWLWELEPLGLESTEQNPEFVIGQSANLNLRLTVTAANGCVQTFEESFPANLIVEELAADSLAVCLGDSLPLNPVFTQSYTYVWSPVTGLSDPFSPNPMAAPLSSTTYTVTITDADDFCQVERSIFIEVPEPLVVDVPPDTTICETDFQLYASSPTAESYSWYFDPGFSVLISDTDTATVTPFGMQTYYLLTRDSFGCRRVDSVSVNGNGLNYVLGADPVICQGDFVTLGIANIDPVDSVTYHWSPEEQVLFFGDTDAPIVQPDSVGVTTFYVNVENQFGCSAIDSISVSVVDTSSQLAFLSELQCGGYEVQFSSSSVNAPFYNWDFGDPNAPDGTGSGSQVSHTYSEPGEYTIMVTLAAQVPCPDTLFKTITIAEPAIVSDFDWNYETCSDTALISFVDQSINNQSNIIDWSWSFSTGQMDSGDSTSLLVEASQSIEATLVITADDGCVDSITQVVNIELIAVELADSLVSCNGEPVALNPDPDLSLNYTWSPDSSLDNGAAANPLASPTATTTYTAVIQDSTGNCEVERSMTVLVPPALTLSLPPDTAICEDAYLLYADSPEAIVFQWSTNPDFTDPFSTEPEVIAPVDGDQSFYVQVVDAFGCTQNGVVQVGSYGIDAVISSDLTICIGDTAQISVINLGEEPLTYEWMPEAGIISGQGTANITLSPEETTSYEVFLSNEFGCVLNSTVQVAIFDFIPPLEVAAEPDTLFGGGTSQLMATENTGYVYSWQPAAGLDASNIPNPTATVNETTIYELVIRDQNGCSNSASLQIVVLNPDCGEPNIFVPNGFTPDGDGLNDQLFVRGNNITELYFVVYDRWGEKVFETDSQDRAWDGTFNGRQLTPDVYGYYLQVTCGNGQQYFNKGNITLIR